MVTTIKFLTEAQAREIRKAITDELGSQKRVFPKKGFWVITNPLTQPVLEYKGVAVTHLGDEAQPLVFLAGRERHRRGIPTIEMLSHIHYVVYPKGKYKFGQYRREL